MPSPMHAGGSGHKESDLLLPLGAGLLVKRHPHRGVADASTVQGG